MFYSCFGDIDRVLLVSHGENFHTLFLTIYLKLRDSCRTIYVTRYQKRLSAF